MGKVPAVIQRFLSDEVLSHCVLSGLKVTVGQIRARLTDLPFVKRRLLRCMHCLLPRPQLLRRRKVKNIRVVILSGSHRAVQRHLAFGVWYAVLIVEVC